MSTLTKEQISQYGGALVCIDEIFDDIRKTVPQTKYLIRMNDTVDIDGVKQAVPAHLVGLWLQSHATDNTRIDWFDRVGLTGKRDYVEDFIKVRAVEIVTIDYVPED